MFLEEMDALGWDQPDVIFVSGDAYVDHPSFAAAILGRTVSPNPWPGWRGDSDPGGGR